MQHRTRSSIFYIQMLWVLVLWLNACSLPPQPGLSPLTPEDTRSQSWTDDQNFQNLSGAIQQSLRYYKRLPDSKVFRYGKKVTYTAREMEVSMQLFLTIIENYDGVARIQEIQKKFHFFESKNSDQGAFFTGYYEPILEGSLQFQKKFPIPLYARPDDLIQADLGLFSKDWKGKKIRGRLQGKKFKPFDSRSDIVDQNSLKERAEIIAYVKNHIELFFLQIQGSGLIKLEDGSLLRVNYAEQNGRPYFAIGKLLKEQIPKEQMSLQSLKKYLYAHPEEVQGILNHNASYTFFRRVEEGPLGNIEVPLTPGRSIAMDHRLIPRGSLVFISTTYPQNGDSQNSEARPLQRFALVQDTGGAIRGHGRADIFWGNGAKAELVAGHMKQAGHLFLLVARKEFITSSKLMSYTDSGITHE